MISWTIPLNILLLMPHIVIVFGSDCQWESMRVVDQKKCCTAIRCHSNRHWTSKNHLLFSLSLSLLIYIPTVNQTFNLIPLLCTEYAWVVFKPTPVMKSYQILARSLAIATIHQVRDFPNVWYIIHMHIYLRIYIYTYMQVFGFQRICWSEKCLKRTLKISPWIFRTHIISWFFHAEDQCKSKGSPKGSSHRALGQPFRWQDVLRILPFFFRLVIEIFWIRLMILVILTYLSDYHINYWYILM